MLPASLLMGASSLQEEHGQIGREDTDGERCEGSSIGQTHMDYKGAGGLAAHQDTGMSGQLM